MVPDKTLQHEVLDELLAALFGRRVPAESSLVDDLVEQAEFRPRRVAALLLPLHLRFRHRAALEQVQKRVASSNAAQVRVVLLVRCAGGQGRQPSRRPPPFAIPDACAS